VVMQRNILLPACVCVMLHVREGSSGVMLQWSDVACV
jgi:hypothetical protein